MSDDKPRLSSNMTDYGVALAKGAFSGLPYVGGLVAELLGTLIPNQRLDRVVAFLKILDDEFANISKDVAAARARTEEFVDLFESGLRQASQTGSDERRRHIAAVLLNGLSLDDLELAETHKLLSLLGDLNDVEVLRLRCLSLKTVEQRAFIERHPALQIPSIVATSSVEDIQREALHVAYRVKLEQLGLVADRRVTSLGRLLLKYIDGPASASTPPPN